ncbi:MAG TPA: hypothetical protein VFE62_00805 [Gemmataceae bacterium]|nr:hypothetical protein [Gemmataceae bacterium]
MHANEVWISMFRRIPASLIDGLSLTLRSGVEIVIQNLLKLEPDFMILRGRMTGTQEGGKILLIPYQEMTVILLGKSLKDPEVEAVFGKGAPPALADMPPVSTETPAPAEEPAKDATVNDGQATVNPAKTPEPVSKKELLAKLRDRLKDAPASK